MGRRATLTAEDKKLIAKHAGCTVEFVRLILRGKRNKDTGMGQEVMRLAKRLPQLKKEILHSL